jgi:hypothetical protein
MLFQTAIPLLDDPTLFVEGGRNGWCGAEGAAV